MNLEAWREDRSYQFGRLLAVLDFAEWKVLTRKERKSRDTNAMRLQVMFTERPMTATGLIVKSVVPYMSKLPGQIRITVEELRDEILVELGNFPELDINRPLGPTYLLGYAAQRNELRSMFSAVVTEEEEEPDETEDEDVSEEAPEEAPDEVPEEE